MNGLESLKSHLISVIDVKDLTSSDELQFLGIKILKHKNGNITLDQSAFIQKIICKFNMNDCKPSKIPLQPKLNLTKSDNIIVEVPYKELIGSLMYLMLCTRPDLCFSVSYFGRFQNCYDISHWKHLKNVIRYLKHTLNIGLSFKKSQNGTLDLSVFVDADYAFDINDRKSTSGYVIKINDNVICWCSKKQSLVALSSCEAEYYALASSLLESMFLENLLYELFSDRITITVFEDNQGTIKIAQTMETKRSKHFDVRFHFVKDLASKDMIKLIYIETNEQLADVMTKALPLTKHLYFCEKLNLVNILSVS